MSTKTKQKPTKANNLAACTILGASDFYLPISHTAIDIETGPLLGGTADDLLDAKSARVVAIGYYEPEKDRYLIAYDDDEAAMLRQFWEAFNSLHTSKAKMIGFNVCGFDLPFMMRRSWFHSVAVPKTLMVGGRYWCDTIVDVMNLWKCGGYKDYISLDALSKYLGVGAKNGNGQHFYALWKVDREKAIAYLVNDVKLAMDCSIKMGFTPSFAV
jgi:DNA polymerase elongation subunit (family B)